MTRSSTGSASQSLASGSESKSHMAKAKAAAEAVATIAIVAMIAGTTGIVIVGTTGEIATTIAGGTTGGLAQGAGMIEGGAAGRHVDHDPGAGNQLHLPQEMPQESSHVDAVVELVELA